MTTNIEHGAHTISMNEELCSERIHDNCEHTRR
jgi:hypothetical protein